MSITCAESVFAVNANSFIKSTERVASMAPMSSAKTSTACPTRAIDALLAADAKRHPAFARARFAASMAVCEELAKDAGMTDIALYVECILSVLVAYEEDRGSGTRPSVAALRRLNAHGRASWRAAAALAHAVYERERVR